MCFDLDIAGLGLDRDAFIADNFSAVKFWSERRDTFPLLFPYMDRSCAIPVSSCASERVFSLVKELVPPERANICFKSIEDLAVLNTSLLCPSIGGNHGVA